jgi:CheY-like chemotaxis protein
MTRLVDDLLDVGRATSGKVRLKLAPLDLGRVVTQVTGNLQRGRIFEDRDLQTDISPVWIEGDEARIEQIVTNILENAAKYTPPGGNIVVRASEAGEDAVLEVIDDGVGINPDLLPRVFDLFAQGQHAIDRGTGGLGIGLTLAKRLTELHGGTITAESAGADKGARFTLRFPAVPAPHGISQPEAVPVNVGSPRRILLIEDNEDARHALVTMLRQYGYRVFAAADGLEGIGLADEIRPDAAIVDIGLPEYDGFAVAKRLRTDFGDRQIFLVAVTGYSSNDMRSEARRAGFNEYLIKPVSPKELVELIEAHFASAVGGS